MQQEADFFNYLEQNPCMMQAMLLGGAAGGAEAGGMPTGGVRSQDDEIAVLMADALDVPRYRCEPHHFLFYRAPIISQPHQFLFERAPIISERETH